MLQGCFALFKKPYARLQEDTLSTKAMNCVLDRMYVVGPLRG